MIFEGTLRGDMAIDNFYLNDMCVKKVEFMEITEEIGAVFEDVKKLFLV